jgi:hypothetical protein
LFFARFISACFSEILTAQIEKVLSRNYLMSAFSDSFSSTLNDFVWYFFGCLFIWGRLVLLVAVLTVAE